MLTIITILQVAFFSGVVCCGLAVLRQTKLTMVSACFVAGCFCGGIFFVINTGYHLPFTAAFCATAIACVIIRFFSHFRNHEYLFVVIPSIYCITPGGALYKSIIAVLQLDFAAFETQFVYILKVAIGCWMAILVVTELMDKALKTKADKQFQNI